MDANQNKNEQRTHRNSSAWMCCVYFVFCTHFLCMCVQDRSPRPAGASTSRANPLPVCSGLKIRRESANRFAWRFPSGPNSANPSGFAWGEDRGWQSFQIQSLNLRFGNKKHWQLPYLHAYRLHIYLQIANKKVGFRSIYPQTQLKSGLNPAITNTKIHVWDSIKLWATNKLTIYSMENIRFVTEPMIGGWHIVYIKYNQSY